MSVPALQRAIEELRAAPRRWLVTGGAGFIGSHLVEALLGLGQEVVVLDDFSTGREENVDAVRRDLGAGAAGRLVVLRGDIRDPDACRSAARGVDVVLHQAALGSVPRSIARPAATHAVNVSGFLEVLEAARAAGVRRIVYASSSSVYGDHPALPKVEDAVGRPLSPYAASKASDELYARAYASCYGLELVGLRYFNVFGPRQDPEGPYAAVIPRWFSALLTGAPVTICGDGETSRDFCYVANVVQANLLAATVGDPRALGEVYNVACGARTTLNELFLLIRGQVAASRPAAANATPVHAGFRPGDVRHSLADIGKASRLLGYRPTHSVAGGLAAAASWYVRSAATAAIAALLAAAPALAAEPGRGPSLEGFTGQLATPSAWTAAPGTAQLLFTGAEDSRFRASTSTRTYGATVGLLPYTEFAGRLTEVSPDPHIRDLSMNVKLQLPLDLVAPALPLALAVGTQDEGGAATYFATRYAVASLRLWRITASLGWGSGPDRMEGLFGGGTIALAHWLELVGDWDGADLNAGVRASVPLQGLGLPLRLGTIAKSSLRREPRSLEWAATLEVPLWLNARPDGARRPIERPPPQHAASPAPDLAVRLASGDRGAVVTAAPAAEAPVELAAEPLADPLVELEDALVEIGFEEVRAGRAGDVVVVEYENNLFNHDEADALYVVLRQVERVGLAGGALAIVVKRNGLRVAEISVPGAAEVAASPPGTPMSPRFRYGHAARRAVWASSEPRNRSAMHSKLVLAPGLRTFVGTEVGVLDWLVSLRPDLIVPLWPGATGFVRADIPAAWSDDFRARGAFRDYRHPERIEYAVVHQAVPLAPGLMAMAGGGVLRATDAGGVGEILWSSPGGALAAGVQGSWTANDQEEVRKALTGSVRLRVAPLDVSLLARAGRFVNGDRGGTVELSRWFGDTQVGVFFTRTEVAMAGAFFTVPLTPRRDMRPGWLQVRGSRRWGHSLGTVVGEERNTITTGLAVAPLAPWNLESSYLDWGRVSGDGLVEPLRALPALSR